MKDIRRGASPPAGIGCSACGCIQPPIYFASGGECWDCATMSRPVANWVANALGVEGTRPRPKQTLTSLAPAELAALPKRQRSIYKALRRGASLRAIARRLRISVQSVAAAEKRLRRRLTRLPRRRNGTP